MKKLINYISAGHGFGISYLLICAAVAAIAFVFTLRGAKEDIIPQAQKIADEILPIKIENGIVVEPANTIREFSSVFSPDPNNKYSVIINTTVDSLDPALLPNGIYLTRKALYTVNPHQTKIISLPTDSLDLPRKDYTSLFTKIFIGALLIGAIIVFGFVFIVLLCMSLFYSLTAWLIAALLKRKTDFDLRMRLSVCGILLFYGLGFILGFIGFSLDNNLFFILMLIWQGIFFYKSASAAQQ